MFETAELGRKLSKREFASQAPDLRTDLLKTQRELDDACFSVVVVVAGNDAAIKEEVLNLLNEWLDARMVQTRAFDERTDEERQRPDYWRYWMALPPRGQIAVVLDGWTSTAIERRLAGKLDDAGFDAALRRAAAFEQDLVRDGTLIVKLWLHIGKADQAKRLEQLEKSKHTRWRVGKRDWAQYERHAEHRAAAERALRVTSTGTAPWTVIEAVDQRFRDVSVGRHLLERLRARIEQSEPDSEREPPNPDVPDPVTILDSLDLTKQLAKSEYETELARLQAKLYKLSRKIEKKQRGVTVVFEGWDAAGKGGAIRRITRALDARRYRVIPVSAPTDEEKAHHYLWRFWRHLPRLGRFTVYDRSWYGRVLVERIEAFASEAEWMRAYAEINEFEEQLVDHGIIVAKFWLHISRDEQLRRFEARAKEPWKQHKLGREDFRNREKWNLYEGAANEMIGRTSTEYAPWTLVEAEDKRWARVAVLRALAERIESCL
jgi:AMP-polyphosphate phosphotransferase